MANERLELKEVGSDRTPHVEAMPDTRECLIDDVSKDVRTGFTVNDQRDMHRMGKKQEMRVCIQPACTFQGTALMLKRGTSGLSVPLASPHVSWERGRMC